MQASLRFVRPNSRTAALRITEAAAAAQQQRTPAHFIALIDISDSMQDNNKLEHVKHCLRLLTTLLSQEDELSLVTFGEAATTLFSRLKMDAGGAATASATIAGLRTNGCTNLSAGLAAVREILADAASSSLKQGVLVLTDGHANRGVYTPPELRAIGRRLYELFPGATMSYVAYGATTHNADLLKGMAEDVNGAYSIVEGLEDAALAMGETLGGILSCVAQNVVVELPAGARVHGPARPRTAAGAVRVGDLYAGTPVLLLVDLPEEGGAGVGAPIPTPVTVRGTLMPSLDLFSIELTAAPAAEQRDVEAELTEHRYNCSELYRRITALVDGGGVSEAAAAALRIEIEALRTALADPLFSDHPILELLRGELPSLEAALVRATSTERPNLIALRTHLLQHEAFVGLGRGTSQPIASADPDYEEAAGDPVQHAQHRAVNTSYLSPVSSTNTRRVAAQLRATASQQPQP